MYLATVEEVNENLKSVKNLIQQKWVFIRLANGASISGSGYGWTIRGEDTRDLGLKLCYGKNDSTSNKCPIPKWDLYFPDGYSSKFKKYFETNVKI